MEIIVWAVFGAVVGWIASVVAETSNRQNLIADIIIGVVGALVGGFTMNFLGQTSMHGINTLSLAVATLGAILVLMTYKSITDQV